MWILPKQLITSPYVQDMGALTSDLNEQSQICGQSLLVKSKPTPVRTWLRKWNKDSWTQHLFGRILKPSHGQSFVDAWIYSLGDTPVSHLVQPANASEKTTLDTSGRTSGKELTQCDLPFASSKMSKDTSRLDSPQSSATWKKMVTDARGEYSVRVKSAHHIKEKESSSWPSVKVSMGGDCPSERKRHTPNLETAAVLSWPTPAVMDTTGGGYKTEWRDGRAVSYHNHKQENPVAYGAKLSDAVAVGQPDQDNHNTHGSHQESWATPQASDHVEGRRTDLDSNQKCLGRDLKQWDDQAKKGQWLSPAACDGEGGVKTLEATKDDPLAKFRLRDTVNHEISATSKMKLNPRWVETLMGLPVGWVMASCVLQSNQE
jgi:hypothetical protein